MKIDIMTMMETIEVIIIIDGEVKGMEEEEDILKIMGTLVIEVRRENMEEEGMVVVEAIAEGLVVEEDVVDFRRGHLMEVDRKNIESL